MNKFAFGTPLPDYRINYVNIDLHHQYGISAAKAQTLPSGETPLAARSEEIGRGHDLRLGTRVLLGHLSIISIAIRSSWHPIQRESFLFCLTYTCWKSKYHERYKRGGGGGGGGGGK